MRFNLSSYGVSHPLRIVKKALNKGFFIVLKLKNVLKKTVFRSNKHCFNTKINNLNT